MIGLSKMHFSVKCEHGLNVYICSIVPNATLRSRSTETLTEIIQAPVTSPRCSTLAKVKLGSTSFFKLSSSNSAGVVLQLTFRSVSVFSTRAATLSTGLRAVQPKAEALAWSSFSPGCGSVNDRGFLAFSSLRFLLGGDWDQSGGEN